jgi:hypothetical protein
MEKIQSGRLRVRGHTLLCLQGFRGEGYSPGFVENLAAIHRILTDFPEKLVEVIQRPDHICIACPNLKSNGCHLNGPGSEEEMKKQDQEVMGRLGITDGTVLPWREILSRISERIGGGDLAGICGSCRWLPLGYCKKGVEDLGRVGL